jgi:hypothetical protein
MQETPKSSRRNRESAESIAISALGFLVTDSDHLEQFLSLSGLTPDGIREAARDPGFLLGVLQHVLSDEKLASGFALQEGLSPEALATAVHVLEHA